MSFDSINVISNPVQQWTEVGTSDSVAGLQDASNSTYIQAPSGLSNRSAQYGIAAPSPPSNHYFRRWRFVITMNTQGGGTGTNCRTRFSIGSKFTWDYAGKLDTFTNIYSGWSNKPLAAGDVLTIEHRPTHNQGLRPRISEAHIEIEYNEAPVVTITAPSGTVQDTRPWIRAFYVDTEGDQIDAYEVLVYSSIAYENPGFHPTPAWSHGLHWYSGTVSTSGVLPDPILMDSDITSGTSYKAFVRVRATDWSDWAESSVFTGSGDPLPAPVVNYEVIDHKVKVTGRISVNYLSVNEYSFEGAETAWKHSETGGLISQQVATWGTPPVGEAVLEVTTENPGEGAFLDRMLPVAPGLLNLSAFVFALTAGDFYLAIQWLDADEELFGSPTYSTPVSIPLNDSVYLTMDDPVEVPEGAVYCYILVMSTDSAMVFDIDDVRVWPGDSPESTRGGLYNPGLYAQLQRREVGGDWHEAQGRVLIDPLEQTFEIIDSTPPVKEEVHYRVLYSGLEEDETSPFESLTTDPHPFTLPKPHKHCWMIRDAQDPNAPALFVDVAKPLPWRWSENEQMAKFAALGRKFPLVVADSTVRAKTISGMVIEFTNRDDFVAFREMRNKQHVWHLSRMVPGIIENYYVRMLSNMTVIESNTDPIIIAASFDVIEVANPYA